MIMAIPLLTLTDCLFNHDYCESQNKQNQHVQNPSASDSHMLQHSAYCSQETVYVPFMYQGPPHLWNIHSSIGFNAWQLLLLPQMIVT